MGTKAKEPIWPAAAVPLALGQCGSTTVYKSVGEKREEKIGKITGNLGHLQKKATKGEEDGENFF